MNKLPIAKRVQILSMLCEGSSMRSISRVADVSINTVAKILVEAGRFCSDYHDDHVRNVKSKRVQADEIWSFCYAKEAHVPSAKTAPDRAGDVWTFTAIDADTKLIISWLVGRRDTECAMAFMHDLKGRLIDRPQLTTDGFAPYLKAVEETHIDVDFGMLVKHYAKPPQEGERRYSPPICVGARKHKIMGNPKLEDVSTSYVERSNLSLRMHNRRFTRLTNAFSKKFQSHVHMIALYTLWYNFIRIHKTLRVTPAMAAGLSDKLWSMEDVVVMMDAVAPKPGRPTSYKKRIADAIER